MKELVFLLEEASAEAMLASLLPRFLNPTITPRFIPFEGKQDLDKQLVKKIRGYQNTSARFIILRDQDSVPDCQALKQGLLKKCAEAGKAEKSLVRIACHELETFYLADLQAVEAALSLSNIAKKQKERKYRQPDHLESPKQELKKLTKQQYQPIQGSKNIGKFLDIHNTRSNSFKHLILAIRSLEAELLIS